MAWADDEGGAARLARLIPAVAEACADPTVTGIRVNPQDGRVRLNTWDRGKVTTAHVCQPRDLEMWINAVAAAHDREFGPHAPTMAAELPAAAPFLGARLQAFGPPVTPGHALVIRKRPTYAPPLDEYVQRGILSPRWRDALGALIGDRKTGVVVGPTDSGKTTLLGACIQEIAARCPGDRLVIIEDTAELHCPADDYLPLRTMPTIGFGALLRDSMRADPTRIILGEIRDEAALTFLDAASTGHPGGLATTHAGSAQEALHRLDRLAQRANVPPQPALVAEAVDFVVVLNGGNQNRQVVDLALVAGYTPDAGFSLTPCSE